MKYAIVLDEFVSHIEPSETGGMTFDEACSEILTYTLEAGYSLQEAFFSELHRSGEGVFLDGKFPLVLA